jgi:hypothetical protein
MVFFNFTFDSSVECSYDDLIPVKGPLLRLYQWKRICFLIAFCRANASNPGASWLLRSVLPVINTTFRFLLADLTRKEAYDSAEDGLRLLCKKPSSSFRDTKSPIELLNNPANTDVGSETEWEMRSD